MKKISELWNTPGLPARPSEQIRQIEERAAKRYVPLCTDFWLYRYLHRTVNADCTLLGDYCFGLFSAYLAKLDSVPLNDAFSAWLKKDTITAHDFEDYLAFVSEHCFEASGPENGQEPPKKTVPADGALKLDPLEAKNPENPAQTQKAVSVFKKAHSLAVSVLPHDMSAAGIRKEILSVSGALGADLIADINTMEEMLLACCGDAGRHKEDLQRMLLSGGKRLRPMLAWVCWRYAGKKQKILPLMCMLELMHTASLIHDDFVDQAAFRRNEETISHKRGGLAAHECGDFLLAKAMEFLETYRGTGINEALSTVAQEMCLGELDQRAGLFVIRDLKKETYYSRIRRKTALLMSESCRCGAVAGGASKEEADICRLYGESLGMAFQIRDDLLDFGFGEKSGKAPLTDIKDGVMTLPVILAQENAPEKLKCILEQRNKTEEDLNYVLRELQMTGAFQSAAEEQKRRSAEAEKAVLGLRGCPERDALLLLVQKISEVSTGA